MKSASIFGAKPLARGGPNGPSLAMRSRIGSAPARHLTKVGEGARESNKGFAATTSAPEVLNGSGPKTVDPDHAEAVNGGAVVDLNSSAILIAEEKAVISNGNGNPRNGAKESSPQSSSSGQVRTPELVLSKESSNGSVNSNVNEASPSTEDNDGTSAAGTPYSNPGGRWNSFKGYR